MKYVSALAFLCISCVVCFGQTIVAEPSETADDSPMVTTSKYILKVGPTLGLVGGGINTQNAEGRKVNPDFWAIPSYGVVINAPFSKYSRLGGRLELAVNTQGTKTRPYETYDKLSSWKGYIHERYTYFTIAPQFNLSGLLLGLGINIPMKGETWNPTTPDDKFTVDRSTMRTALDFRIGGTINVWSTDVGALFIDVGVKYTFSGLYKDNLYAFGGPVNEFGAANFAGNQTTTHIEFIPVSGQLGITYLFNLKL
ncbi:MAG: hypothetical protein HQ472_02525 [Ignavibacteria bacterium]|nr:hypothetical protein [Ignavibacteria bacterium]